MSKRKKPDITVTDGKWTITQTYAFSDIYQLVWILDGRERISQLGNYKTEKQMQELLKHADNDLRILERDYVESNTHN